jgi:hypothetical protein
MITQRDALHGYHAISGIYWTAPERTHIVAACQLRFYNSGAGL